MPRSSSARKKARREKARRARRAHDKLVEALDFDAVFNFDTLFSAAKMCKSGVIWKNSVITFDKNRAFNCTKLNSELHEGSYKKHKSTHFVLHERGKLRHISAVAFPDRVVQRALCDVSLVPVLSYGLIYDNSASLPGRGTSFARKRFEKRLLTSCRTWDEPYIALVDFSNYFGSIDSYRAFEMLYRHYMMLAQTDKEQKSVERLMSVAKIFVCDEDHLGLGNQTSQTLAVWYLNELDHMAGRYGHYGRYMDDAYCICATYDAARAFLERYERMAHELGLNLNKKKTRIVPVKRTKLTFLKRVYSFDANKCGGAGGLEITMAACAMRASRHHLKGIAHLYDRGALSDEDVVQVLASLKSNVLSTSHAAGLYHKFVRESGLEKLCCEVEGESGLEKLCCGVEGESGELVLGT